MEGRLSGVWRGLVGCGLACVALALGFDAGAQTLPPGFSEELVFGGLTEPTAVEFASDGRVFVAEKSGLIKVFSSLAATTATVFADLRTQVHNFWDRGLLGMALHPNFPATPYVYVLYTYDAAIGGTAPRWGTIGAASDGCPTPPDPTADGCVVSGRLSRLPAVGNLMVGSEQVLIEDWCQQFPSHSVGSLAFGLDGALYVGAGDGANFNAVDYGQFGSPLNPCGDPPAGIGGVQTPPAAEGGALRSQSVERPAGEPRVLNGAILRIDPETGQALPDNPLAASPDFNERRIIAHGLRNPFRITPRPGSGELWVGDVGWTTAEEINRIQSPTGPPPNFGWPCYEGAGRQAGYDSANLDICEGLYARPGAATPPAFQYNHADQVVPGEACPAGGASVSGLAFYQGGAYPGQYNGALFFADFSRNCIWTIFNPTGDPPGAGPSMSFGFNEASGTTSADLSGNNHPATLVGGAAWSAAGISGNAVQFDGSTGHVTVGSPGMPTGDFTAAAWVNLGSTAVFQTVLEMLDPGSLGWELDVEAGGRLTVWTDGVQRLVTAATVPVNTWTYLTLRRQGATWTVFINGVAQPETGTDGTVFAFGTCPFSIGVDADSGCTGLLNGYLQGRVDEVRVYNRALSDAEIQADMSAHL